MQKQHMETNEVQANGGEILNKRHNREGQASAAYHVSIRQWLKVVFVFTALALMNSGCGSSKPQKQNRDFFTSGSREADQRASQRMAKDEQLTGSGEGAGEKNVKKASKGGNSGAGGTNTAAQAQGKTPLFERLGSEAGLSKIVDDFTARVLEDPRVNWERHDLKPKGITFHRTPEVMWKATPENVAQLKKHLVQFLALTTGGPAKYDGKEIKSAHAAMQISNPEFDAVVGDLKATLDKLQIPNTEQKELLAIVESTRPQIVTQR